MGDEVVYVRVSWHLYTELILGNVVESLVGEWYCEVGVLQ